MTKTLKKTLAPAELAVNTSEALTGQQIKIALESIVATLALLVEALDAYEQAEHDRVVRLSQNDTRLQPPEPGLAPNPNSSPSTELNSPTPG